MCGTSDGFSGSEVHGEFGVEDESQLFQLGYLSNGVGAGVRGWEGRVDVEGGQGRAGLVLTTTGLLKGGGLEEGHDFCLQCVDLHTISHAPFLAYM